MENLNHRVAVYGSLLSGMNNHNVISSFIPRGEAVFLGEDVTKNKFAMYDLGFYPGLSLEEKHNIHIEVYDISENCLKYIRSLEGYTPNDDNGLYSERIISTKYGDAYIYIYNRRFHGQPIDQEGIINWKKYLKTKIENVEQT